MIPILVGMGSFLLPLAFDAADTSALRAVKWLCALASPVLYLGAAIVLCADSWRLALPIGARLAAGACAAAFLLLLVQSLLVEVGSPVRTRSGGRRALVTTGTYALVRHPGVLWYLFFHLMTGIAAGSVPFLLAAPLWAGVNAAVAAVQDRFIFPRVFGVQSYDEYRRTVPFVVPRRAGFRRCLATLSLLRMGGNGR